MSNLNDDPSSISSDDAQSLLAPHLERLATCFEEGWNRWRELAEKEASLAAPLTSRTRASFVNDHIWQAIKISFAGVEGAHVIESRGLRILCIENQLTLRFKKLDKQLRSSNIPTHQQQAFVRQLPLPEIPEIVRLTTGYILNRLETEIETVAVTLPMGNAIEWSFLVPLVHTEITTSFASVVEPARTRKVRVKKTDESTRLRAENE